MTNKFRSGIDWHRLEYSKSLSIADLQHTIRLNNPFRRGLASFRLLCSLDMAFSSTGNQLGHLKASHKP